MIGKVIGAIAGAQASKHTKAMGGTGGAVFGALAVPVIRRISWPALLAIGAGGYLVKRLADKNQQASPDEPTKAPVMKKSPKAASANSTSPSAV